MNTATNKTDRPLTADQTERLRTILDLIRANGGSTRLDGVPTSLINRGLVIRTGRGLRGAAGCGARYTLTAAGMEIANVAEQARVERIAIRRANAGSNLCL
jgi:hypothetical protein